MDTKNLSQIPRNPLKFVHINLFAPSESNIVTVMNTNIVTDMDLPVTGSAVGALTCTPNKYRELQQGHVTDLTTLVRCFAEFASRSEK